MIIGQLAAAMLYKHKHACQDYTVRKKTIPVYDAFKTSEHNTTNIIRRSDYKAFIVQTAIFFIMLSIINLA